MSSFLTFLNTMPYTCDPVCLDETSINSLSFADDLVILPESQSGLQSALNKLENYCHKWQLTVNKNKTKVMIFHTGNTFQSQFFLSKIKTY